MFSTAVGSDSGSIATTASRAAPKPSAMAIPWSASPITPSSRQSSSRLASISAAIAATIARSAVPVDRHHATRNIAQSQGWSSIAASSASRCMQRHRRAGHLQRGAPVADPGRMHRRPRPRPAAAAPAGS